VPAPIAAHSGSNDPPGSPLPDEEDQQALAALRAGDRRTALTRLMQTHGGGIHHFCWSMLGDRSLSDDVHQAVFVQAFEKMGSYRGEGSLRAWLYGIARHRCLDAAKVRRRWRLRFVLAPDPEPAADPAPAVEHASDTDRHAAALADCVRRLAAHVRMAVLLRYQEGLSYDEIARMSQERPGTLQARVARALPLLRACIASADEGRP
jgi:RNA polymerase sigma factor (sigma-70 family)